MAEEPVFLYVARYPNEAEAREDYQLLVELHAAGVVGTYDAAVVTKDDHKVHVHKHEKPTQHGAWTGIAVGAVVGIIFPPSIIGSAAVAGVAGGLIGHFWGGLSRSDVKALGDFLDEGQAALLVIGKSKLQQVLDRELKRATKSMEREIKADRRHVEKTLEESQKA
ncbi:MAG TPA: DUF1269 domain-containing protein [Acidimicrobiales bacterium]|nr:DUF1269 domain-containing protein [Acidimicrobiales bacterium]